MSMTLEELKEKLAVKCVKLLMRKGQICLLEDKDIQVTVGELHQAFLKWYKENNIYQVVEGELPENPLIDPSSLIATPDYRFGSSPKLAYKNGQQDMLKWHKQSLKPVSEVLKP